MGRATETVATVNSTIRTLLALVIVIVLGLAGFFIREQIDGKERELATAQAEILQFQDKLKVAETKIGSLEADIAAKALQIDRLETAVKLLKTDQRLARLECISQEKDPSTERIVSRILFSEVTPDGDAIGEPREFQVDGEVVYLDNWVVKFDDSYVEQADLYRGTSLALFRRIFGEFQSPAEGFLIDEVGSMPQAYGRGGQPSEFEQSIWNDFWTFANDREKAREKGIRAAHGEALSVKLQPGQAYRISLRASDGLSITPDSDSSTPSSDTP